MHRRLYRLITEELRGKVKTVTFIGWVTTIRAAPRHMQEGRRGRSPPYYLADEHARNWQSGVL